MKLKYLVGSMAALIPTVLQAQTPDSAKTPAQPKAISIFSDLKKSGYYEASRQIEAIAAAPVDTTDPGSTLTAEVAGWIRAMVGDVRGAMAAFDAMRGKPRSALPAGFDSFKPRPAREEIVERARSTRLVVINEAHHMPMTRVLTYEVLRDLYKQGYRYFAVEAVYGIDRPDSAYPKVKAGYTSDPVYAQVIRTAIRLGYTVVGYDTFPPSCKPPANCFSARDSMAALNLVARTFAKDRNAKVLVHVGYSHVNQQVSKFGSKPLAYWLSKLTNIDPLTIDQTQMVERTDSMLEEPEYRRAGANGWLTEPVVLQEPDGSFYASSTDGVGDVDMQVFTPRTTYVAGRPAWLMRLGRRIMRLDLTQATDGRFLQQLIPPDGGTYLVQAFEQGSAPDAVPFDQILVHGSERQSLALAPGTYRVSITGSAGFVNHAIVIVQ